MGSAGDPARKDATFADHAGNKTRAAKVLDGAPVEVFPGAFGDDGMRPLLSLIASVLGMDLVLLGHVNQTTYTAVASYSHTGRVTFPRGSTIPIEETYCREEITAEAPFAIGDAANDPLYRDHPGLTQLGLRAYVGVPLVLEDGTLFGTLCGVDTEPRDIDPEMVERMLMLSGVVSSEISRRFGLKRMSEAERALERANRHLQDYVKSLAQTTAHRTEQVRELTGSLARAQNAQVETMRRFRRLHESLGEFTYTVAHDVSEPLRRLDTLAEALLKDTQHGVDTSERLLVEQMRQEAASVRDRILALREFADQLRADFPVEPVSLGGVVEEVLANLASRIRASGATVTVDPNLPVVTGQRVRLQQLFRRLLENCLDHAEAPDLRLEIRATDEGGFLEVRDNGVGIPALYREQVFRIFNRGRLPPFQGCGHGVGLTLVQHVVELHGGHVWIEEAPGGGTSVRFTLPGVAKAEAETEAPAPVTT